MSLISQNAILNNKRQKPVEEPPAAAADGSALADAGGANKSGAKPESEPTVSKKKKRREVDEKSRMGQEEVLKLESYLLGLLCAPPEFGTEVEEAVGRDAPLFFVGDEKAVYEEDL